MNEQSDHRRSNLGDDDGVGLVSSGGYCWCIVKAMGSVVPVLGGGWARVDGSVMGWETTPDGGLRVGVLADNDGGSDRLRVVDIARGCLIEGAEMMDGFGWFHFKHVGDGWTHFYKNAFGCGGRMMNWRIPCFDGDIGFGDGAPLMLWETDLWGRRDSVYRFTLWEGHPNSIEDGV